MGLPGARQVAAITRERALLHVSPLTPGLAARRLRASGADGRFGPGRQLHADQQCAGCGHWQHPVRDHQHRRHAGRPDRRADGGAGASVFRQRQPGGLPRLCQRDARSGEHFPAPGRVAHDRPEQRSRRGRLLVPGRRQRVRQGRARHPPFARDRLPDRLRLRCQRPEIYLGRGVQLFAGPPDLRPRQPGRPQQRLYVRRLWRLSSRAVGRFGESLVPARHVLGEQGDHRGGNHHHRRRALDRPPAHRECSAWRRNQSGGVVADPVRRDRHEIGSISAFTEANAGAADLSVGRIRANRTDLLAGATVTTPSGGLRPYLRTAYRSQIGSGPDSG